MSSIYTLSDRISRCLKTSIQANAETSKYIPQVHSLSIHPHVCLRDSRYYNWNNSLRGDEAKRAHTHLKPSFVHCSTVSSSVPGGVRWTIWSNILVDMVVPDNIGTYDGAIETFGKSRRLFTIPWDWAFPLWSLRKLARRGSFPLALQICTLIFV